MPKREIFDRSNFPDFYAIKSSWVGDLVVKILTYYFNLCCVHWSGKVCGGSELMFELGLHYV